MRKEGLPVEGLCFTAGIPSTEKAEVGFRGYGLWGSRVEDGQIWIDTSLKHLTGDWLGRVEERFAGVNGVVKARLAVFHNPGPSWRLSSRRIR